MKLLVITGAFNGIVVEIAWQLSSRHGAQIALALTALKDEVKPL